MKKYFLVIATILLVFGSCVNPPKDRLKNGKWRAEFKVQNQVIPFMFDVDGAESDTATVTLINGVERVVLKNITYSNDTVNIPIENYDAVLRGVFLSEGKINGRFIKNYIEGDEGVPFEAVWTNDPRFTNPIESTDISVDGKWDIKFINSEKNDTTYNVGIFAEQENGNVTGSILTTTGDLRYLEGSLTKNGFELSAFSGLSPYLINADFRDKDHFEGKFYTTGGVIQLYGVRNDNASLADPYSLTSLKKGYTQIAFSFPNLEGENISLSDSRYKGKVVIISVLGSWCPNCLDEMEYLAPWYRSNHHRGVEIIGLAFERKDDPEYVKKVLSNMIKRYDVGYEILFAGKLGAESTERALPAIDKIQSYPTTIFIDKKGEVRKIHTGFNGPATGLFYDEFKKDFNQLINILLDE